jgi:hypothetical protein
VEDVLPAAPGDPLLVRLAAKGLIARDVAEGRRTLLEGAALFRALDRLPPAPVEPDPRPSDPFIPIPTRTADEWACWQVARWAVSVPTDRRARGVARRLAAQFTAEVRRAGDVRLAEPRAEEVEAVLARARGEQPAAQAGE